MRRVALVLAAVLVAGGVAALVTARDPGGPFPSAERVRSAGFAAWPVDTVEEAVEECDGAPEWRTDERETAFRFAADVMGYPAPAADDWSHEDPNRARFLVTTPDVPGVFLGSVLELARFGRCWYLVDAEPREGEPPYATVGFVYRDGAPHLFLGRGTARRLPPGRVGYGDWDHEVPAHRSDLVVEIPEVDAGATGHAIYLDPNGQGVSERAGVDTFGTIPPPPSGRPSAPLDRAELSAGGDACGESYTAKTPARVLRQVFDGALANWFLDDEGYPYEELRGFRPAGRGRWSVTLARTQLVATIDRPGRCARLVSLTTVDRDPPLRHVRIDRGGATIEVGWSGGDDVFVHAGTTRTGAGGLFRQLREPITLPWSDGPPDAETPVYALAVLYENERIVAVSYDLYPAGS